MRPGELGDAGEYGDFASFKSAIRAATLEADTETLTILYDSPSQGMIEMGWEGSVLVNGVAAPLEDYGRYENPWSQSGFPADDISFNYGDSYLELNLDAGKREASSYYE